MTESLYRLSLAPALEQFRPEVEHACGFLDSAHMLRRTDDADRVLHYGPGAPPHAVAVPAALFPACVRTDENGIHPQLDALRAALGAPGGLTPANGTSQSGHLAYDALGLIFLLLSRLEERDHPARDRYGRFPLSAALFAPEAGRLYPWADRAARDIAAALTARPDPAPRTGYSVRFTHDVDMLKGYHRPWEPLRWAVGDVVKRGRPRAALARLGSAYFGGEPWRSARRLMGLSERSGIKSRFYFMGPSRDPMDSPYVARMPGTLQKLAAEIRARGHVIGFHPGIHTATDASEWQRQRRALEGVIGGAVREGRQHVLRYDAALTPEIWSSAGMELDCTPAYPEAVGFRTGSCRPHRAYDLVQRRTLPLIQLSTAAMEFGLFGGKYRSLSLEEAVADCLWAIDACREYGGTFVMLLHTGGHSETIWTWGERVLAAATRDLRPAAATSAI